MSKIMRQLVEEARAAREKKVTINVKVPPGTDERAAESISREVAATLAQVQSRNIDVTRVHDGTRDLDEKVVLADHKPEIFMCGDATWVQYIGWTTGSVIGSVLFSPGGDVVYTSAECEGT